MSWFPFFPQVHVIKESVGVRGHLAQGGLQVRSRTWEMNPESVGRVLNRQSPQDDPALSPHTRHGSGFNV